MTMYFFSEGPCMDMKDLRMLFGPGIYILWKENEALYVGSAKNVMHRISHPKHEQLRLAMAEATKIEFDCEYDTFHDPRDPGLNMRMVRDEEARKILELQPKYNRTGKLGTTNRFSS